jgi:hypothetical protein
MEGNQDVSQKNQWRLVGMYFRPDRTGTRARFCRHNNYPDTSDGPNGKFHTQLRKKIVSVENLTNAERENIVRHGVETGQDIRRRASAPGPARAPIPAQLNTEVPVNSLDFLAEMPVENKMRVLKIMENLPPSQLPTVIRLVIEVV